MKHVFNAATSTRTTYAPLSALPVRPSAAHANDLWSVFDKWGHGDVYLEPSSTAERASTVGAKIATFLVEEQCKKLVMKTLTGKLGLQTRPLPLTVMFEIEEALPEIRGTVLSAAGLASLCLRCGGDAW